jgi:hypothetical protein
MAGRTGWSRQAVERALDAWCIAMQYVTRCTKGQKLLRFSSVARVNRAVGMGGPQVSDLVLHGPLSLCTVRLKILTNSVK